MRVRRADVDDRGVDAEDPNPSVHDCLECLEGPGVLDALVIAHDIDGIPMKVIARELGISVATAYARRARAVKALQVAAARQRRASPGEGIHVTA